MSVASTGTAAAMPAAVRPPSRVQLKAPILTPLEHAVTRRPATALEPPVEPEPAVLTPPVSSPTPDPADAQLGMLAEELTSAANDIAAGRAAGQDVTPLLASAMPSANQASQTVLPEIAPERRQALLSGQAAATTPERVWAASVSVMMQQMLHTMSAARPVIGGGPVPGPATPGGGPSFGTIGSSGLPAAVPLAGGVTASQGGVVGRSQ